MNPRAFLNPEQQPWLWRPSGPVRVPGLARPPFLVGVRPSADGSERLVPATLLGCNEVWRDGAFGAAVSELPAISASILSRPDNRRPHHSGRRLETGPPRGAPAGALEARAGYSITTRFPALLSLQIRPQPAPAGPPPPSPVRPKPLPPLGWSDAYAAPARVTICGGVPPMASRRCAYRQA